MTSLGQNPNPPLARARQLSPAADMPPHWQWAALCQLRPPALQKKSKAAGCEAVRSIRSRIDASVGPFTPPTDFNCKMIVPSETVGAAAPVLPAFILIQSRAT